MNIILASTSTLFGGNYLEYLTPEIEKLFSESTKLFLFRLPDQEGFLTTITQKSAGLFLLH